VQQLMEEAEKERKAVTIYVESFNPSARLFERLSFARKDEEGIHVLMKWFAKPSA
jgi:hypothetical protein